MNKKIAALFIADKSTYFDMEFIDGFNKERDAKSYTGSMPVIAHPPCQLWGKMAKVNFVRWGGEHNRPGNDQGCFKFALDQVNQCGGVLEHPAQSYAWKEYGLEKPNKSGWSKSGIGWVCEVWQSAYGHKANKATWLYYVGEQIPYDLDWRKIKGSHQVGFQDQRGKKFNKPTLSKIEANATPVLFRDELINLAMFSKSISDN